jgi:hypothetical protein
MRRPVDPAQGALFDPPARRRGAFDSHIHLRGGTPQIKSKLN